MILVQTLNQVIAMINNMSITFIIIIGDFIQHYIFFHIRIQIHILNSSHFTLNRGVNKLY